MYKNKLLVMLATFAVLVAITPFVFAKLMNAKFNQMIAKINQKGYKVVQIADESGYLKTKRVFKVIIGPDKLKDRDYKKIVLKVTTEFYNLPVTTVRFKGRVDNIVLSDDLKNIEKPLNDYVRKNVRFEVDTPNFKKYAYTFDDIVLKGSPNVEIRGIYGYFFYYPGLNKNETHVKTIVINDKDVKLKLDDLVIKNSFSENELLTKSDFNLRLSLEKKINLSVINAQIQSGVLKHNKKVDLINRVAVGEFKINDLFFVKKFNANLKIKDIDADLFKKAVKTRDEETNRVLIDKILEKGVTFDIKSDTEKITAFQSDLGNYDLNMSLKFLPTKNIEEKFAANNLDFIDLKFHLVISKKLANVLERFYPQSIYLLMLGRESNNKIVVDLAMKDGKITRVK